MATVLNKPMATGSCWIDTDGNFYPVEFAGHYYFAKAQCERLNITDATDYVYALEKRGWLHISNGPGRNVTTHGVNIVTSARRPTTAQVDTVFDWAYAFEQNNRHDYAEAILKWIGQFD